MKDCHGIAVVFVVLVLFFVTWGVSGTCNAQPTKEQAYQIELKWKDEPSGYVQPSETPDILYKKVTPITIINAWCVTKTIFTNSDGELREITDTDREINIPSDSGVIVNSGTKNALLQLYYRIHGIYGKGTVKRALFDPSKSETDPTAQLSNWLEIKYEIKP